MATALILLLLLILFAPPSLQSHNPTSPYLSPHTFFLNHHKMLQSFKIYVYPNDDTASLNFKDPSESAFYSTLLNSSFLTSDPDEAHLFFIPFALSSLPSRSISRLIRRIRSTHPYWNRTLGADHFYLHCHGLAYHSDRNLVELKKNALQISCFPTVYGHFIPHKDITLPPITHSPRLNYHLLNADPEIPRDELKFEFKYCLMAYDDGGSVRTIGAALREGCVPVVAVGSGGGAAQDLPMMGVVRWAEMAVFVGAGVSVDDGEELRKVARDGGYGRMRRLGVVAARHFAWSGGDDQYDAFHSVLYQLWVRRHVIRYARFQVSSS